MHKLPTQFRLPTGPLRLYYLVYLALMGLLVLTLVVWLLDLGPATTVLALAVATVKALLVIYYFMHLKDSTRLVWLFAAAGFAWLGIMLVLTLSDYLSRGWITN
jgi:cytochrome c oxidase subunit IV